MVFLVNDFWSNATVIAFLATAKGDGTDIYDPDNLHSSGTFTVPSAWNGRKARVSAMYRKEAGGSVTLSIAKGGTDIPGMPKNTCETNSNDESMSAHSAPVVVATGDTFTVTASSTFGTGNGNAVAIELLRNSLKGCLANRITSGYATGSAGLTVVQWNNEVYDTDGFHDNTTNPSRMTIPSGTTGLFRLSASIAASGSTAELGIAFYKNGTLITSTEYDTENVSGNISAVSMPLTASAGDYFEVAIRAGSAPTVDVSNNSWFAIEELPSGLTYQSASWSATSLSSGSFIQVGSTLTIPSGVTRVRAGFWGAKTSTTGTFALKIQKNGADFTEGIMNQSNNAGGEFCHGMSIPFSVTPGDTLTCLGYTNAGAQNCTGFFWFEEVPDVT